MAGADPAGNGSGGGEPRDSRATLLSPARPSGAARRSGCGIPPDGASEPRKRRIAEDEGLWPAQQRLAMRDSIIDLERSFEGALSGMMLRACRNTSCTITAHERTHLALANTSLQLAFAPHLLVGARAAGDGRTEPGGRWRCARADGAVRSEVHSCPSPVVEQPGFDGTSHKYMLVIETKRSRSCATTARRTRRRLWMGPRTPKTARPGRRLVKPLHTWAIVFQIV